MEIKTIEQLKEIFINKTNKFITTFKKVKTSKDSMVYIVDDSEDNKLNGKHQIILSITKQDYNFEIGLYVFSEDEKEDTPIVFYEENYNTKEDFKTTIVAELQEIFFYGIEEQLKEFIT